MRKYSWSVEVPYGWLVLPIRAYPFSLQSEYISGKFYISSSDQYHTDRDHHIYPKSKYGISGQFSSYGFPNIQFKLSTIL